MGTGGPLLGDGWKDTVQEKDVGWKNNHTLFFAFFFKHNRRGCKMVQQVKVLSRDPHGGRRETTEKKVVLWLIHTYPGMHSLYLQINKEMQFKNLYINIVSWNSQSPACQDPGPLSWRPMDKEPLVTI